MAIQLSSPAFRQGATIPQKYTCDAEDLSPPLAWGGVPEGTRSLALIVDDPDAPGGTWTHWVVFNLPPELAGLAEGVSLPDDARAGRNDFRRTRYGGPCPPPGKPHRYYFRLYALDRMLDVRAGASRDDVLAAMKGCTLARGELMGTYGR